MSSYKTNHLRIRNPAIDKILRTDRYDTEDISEAERKYIMKHTPKPREARTDLLPGDIVVVLEGTHTGKRVVFIKQLEGCKALVSGISTVNGVSAFMIDEKYLFKLSAKIEIPSNIDVNVSSVYESKANEPEKLSVELSPAEKTLEQALLASVARIPYMKSYLAEPFKVDNSVEFYSQKY